MNHRQQQRKKEVQVQHQGQGAAKVAPSQRTPDGMDGPEALEFAMYLFCKIVSRPDKIVQFGRELGLNPQQIQYAWNLSLNEVNDTALEGEAETEVQL